MCRCSDVELYCVSTYIRSMPEWIALLIVTSISRYLPAIGTAGLLRIRVSGSRRVAAAAAEDHDDDVPRPVVPRVHGGLRTPGQCTRSRSRAGPARIRSGRCP